MPSWRAVPNGAEKNLRASFSVLNLDGGTPLLIACHKGHEAVVRVLLDRGAPIDQADMHVELGDGSGTVIALSRAVNGTDNLTISQSVGTCTSELGFQVNVRNTSGKEDTQ